MYLSQHDANVIYAAFNHHKYGDFKPYIFKSSDKGKTWNNISNNIDKRGSVYSIEEDHIDKNLIFCGTEFGVYFSPNGGDRWKKIEKGLPTVAVRDIAIQQRENDLVLGTFGRGFYILDDYSSFRTIENSKPTQTAIIYPIREALMWEKSLPLGLPGKAFQGDNFFTAENLGPEALITYFYNDDYKSLKEKRQEKEKKLIEDAKDAVYPNYNALKTEVDEIAPKLVFTIKDASGRVVKKVIKKPKAGLQRFKWDLRYEQQIPINLNKPSFYNPFSGKRESTLVSPGVYTVELHILDTEMKLLVEPITFSVKALNNTIMPAEDKAAKVAFQRVVNILDADIRISQSKIKEMTNKIKHIKEAVKLSEQPIAKLNSSVLNIESKLKEIKVLLNGDPLKNRLDIGQLRSPADRVGSILYEQKYSTAAPTITHVNSLAIAKKEYSPIQQKVDTLYENDIKELEQLLKKVGAPYTPGRLLNKQ